MVDETKMNLWKNKTALIFALEKIPFFDDLSDEELHRLMQYMSLYEIEKGEILFEEGEVGRYVGFIVDGKLEVLKKSITTFGASTRETNAQPLTKQLKSSRNAAPMCAR